ncbi:MAG: hypothetical protein IPQ22_10740 [Rhodoferax sp.]|nr:hypothetical protein [Rhodoferax sp.]
MAADGVVCDLWSASDTLINRVKLGRCASQNGEGGWCQVRAVCLMDIRSHEQLDAQVGAMTWGELNLTGDL